MELNSVGLTTNFYVDETQQSKQSGKGGDALRAGSPPPRPPDDFKLSGMGQILNSVKETESASKEEVKSYMDSIMEALKNGTFNAAELAEDAPAWLVEAAEESGVNLEDALNDMASHYNNFAPGKPGTRTGSEPPSVKQAAEDSIALE